MEYVLEGAILDGTLCEVCESLVEDMYPDEEGNRVLKTPPGHRRMCNKCSEVGRYGLYIGSDNKMRVITFTDSITEELRKWIGEDLEHVNPKNLPLPYVMIVHGNGFALNLPVNEFGSYLYQSYDHGHDIVGNIAIIKRADEGRGDWTFLTATDLKLLRDIFKKELKTIESPFV